MAQLMHSYIGLEILYPVYVMVLVSFTEIPENTWTFAAALADYSDSSSSCLCIYVNAPPPPGFVGMDYFCDTGLLTFPPGFLGVDPLWDGEGWAPSSCCSFNTPPWFHKQLPQPTTDDIEMRVCRDEVAYNEDIAIEIIEIYYVQ